MSPYLELAKPRLVLLALLTAAAAFFMATEGRMDYPLLGHLLLGSALVGGGVNALNQYIERGYDAQMPRTRKRPLPSGRLTPKKALIFGSASFTAGLAYLWAFTNPATAAAGLFVFISYVLIYTPLKRKTAWNTYVGAVAGALPVLLGWTAVKPFINLEALVLFLILFVWQLPHFYAIAWLYRDDYRNAGFKMLTAGDKDGRSTAWQIAVYSFALFALSVAPTFAGFAGLTYLFMAIFFGVNLCGFAAYLIPSRLAHARAFVYASIIYLFVLNITLLIDKT